MTDADREKAVIADAPDKQGKAANENAARLDAELKRLKEWFSFLRWVLGVFVLGLVALALQALLGIYDALNERQRAETARLEAESGFLKEFLDKALDDNLLKRQAFAEFMSTVNTNEQMRTLWHKYAMRVDQDIQLFQRRLTDARLALDDLQAQLQRASDDGRTQALSREIDIRQAEIRHLQEVLSPTLAGQRMTNALSSPKHD